MNPKKPPIVYFQNPKAYTQITVWSEVSRKCVGTYRYQKWQRREDWRAWSLGSQRRRCWDHQAVQYVQLQHLGSGLMVSWSYFEDQTFSSLFFVISFFDQQTQNNTIQTLSRVFGTWGFVWIKRCDLEHLGSHFPLARVIFDITTCSSSCRGEVIWN